MLLFLWYARSNGMVWYGMVWYGMVTRLQTITNLKLNLQRKNSQANPLVNLTQTCIN